MNNKRFTYWGPHHEFRGRTGMIVRPHQAFPRVYKTLLDGDTEDSYFFEDEMYFFDHEYGYNQPCAKYG